MGEERELTQRLRSAVVGGDDGVAEVIRGKLKEVRSHPNYKGRLQQAQQATAKKKAAASAGAPCEKTPEELEQELKEIKAENPGMLDGMKLAKLKDEAAAKKKKANSSAASTSSKASSERPPTTTRRLRHRRLCLKPMMLLKLHQTRWLHQAPRSLKPRICQRLRS